SSDNVVRIRHVLRASGWWYQLRNLGIALANLRQASKDGDRLWAYAWAIDRWIRHLSGDVDGEKTRGHDCQCGCDRSHLRETCLRSGCHKLLPNESRLSCGALKKNSFHNLPAPSAPGAC